MSLVSTVPGAITTLQGYLTTVAAATTVTDVQVYLGKQATETQLAFNLMMVGDWHEGVPVAPASFDWAAIPGQSKLIKEEYALQACIACWAGGFDPLSRLNDAYSLLNGVHQQIRNDLGGSNNLSPSGSWGALHVTISEFGRIGTGWGVVLGLELHVINAQISG